ncbi:M10 family metallopeptidase C-terminal domain-containing protein [Pseudomonas sp. K2I15]|uniref:M10 family metallopeptidase C-terminal domain-containing protein n=1 Tax=unclassified Pseudomonas TaxID=196821 RepID=UPI000B4D8757|nr:M10 family metallopeptidase C-terminal domain-containing protein [Pseudomonas sp. K2I15]OWP70460.1 metalloprotease [Pseudomonas sp. K2I15]
MKVTASLAGSQIEISAVKPSFTTDEAAAQLVRGGFRHYDRNGDGKIDLSFTMDERFSAQQKVSVRMALQAWSDVTNINFKENASGVDGSISILANPEGNGGVAGLPNKYYGDLTATIGIKNASDAPRPGDNFSITAIHELGHALGLEHPADYGKSVPDYESTAYVQDTKANSVMSYWSETKQAGHNFKWRQPSAPMKDDIAAMQKLYGANLDTRNTDTTYGFNSNTDREHLSLNSPGDVPVFTVWDGGGNDTLDFSGFRQNQLINLNAEAFSDVGGLRGNVAIAKGVGVENGIGGAGDDVMIGNQMGNRIKGGVGADKLTGGGGEDVFVYDEIDESTLKWPDEILDFTSGTDKIDLSGVLKKSNLNNLDAVERFTGRPGEIILSHNPATGQGSLSLDLTGNGIADVFIKSRGVVRRGDLLTGGRSNPAVSKPETGLEPQPESKPKPKPDNANTVYGFNSNTGNPAMSLVPGSGAPRFTVRDSHGYDTLDFSGFKHDQRIDLRAGAASSVGGPA